MATVERLAVPFVGGDFPEGDVQVMGAERQPGDPAKDFDPVRLILEDPRGLPADDLPNLVAPNLGWALAGPRRDVLIRLADVGAGDPIVVGGGESADGQDQAENDESHPPVITAGFARRRIVRVNVHGQGVSGRKGGEVAIVIGRFSRRHDHGRFSFGYVFRLAGISIP